MTSVRPPFTSEICSLAKLHMFDGPSLVAWAGAMLVSGFESEHLNILVGETAPFNSFELEGLLTRVAQKLEFPVIHSQIDAVAILATAIIYRNKLGWDNIVSTLGKLSQLTEHRPLPDEIFYFWALYDERMEPEFEILNYSLEMRTKFERHVRDRFDDWAARNSLEEWKPYEWAKFSN